MNPGLPFIYKEEKVIFVHNSFERKRNLAGYLFVLPSLTVFLVFVFAPLIVSIVFSVFKFDMMFNNFTFARLENYSKMFLDERFWNSLHNTLYYTAATVVVQVALALLVAIAISKKLAINSVFKGVFFIPSICSMTIISIIWSFLLNKDIGVVSYYLSLIGINVIDWLNDPVWAMPAVIIVSIWRNFGLSMVILLAGIDGIPDVYYEASEIDGAGKIKQFFKITLPMLIPTVGFVVITTMIGSFQVFDQIFVMTRGGPLFKTETVVQYIYHVGFESFDLPVACAIAEVLLVILLAVTALMFKVQRNMERNI